jgi:hypothetical protein
LFVLSSEDRDALRQRAIAAWEQSKRLHQEASMLYAGTLETPPEAESPQGGSDRAEGAGRHWRGSSRSGRDRLTAELPLAPNALEVLVDRALRANLSLDDTEAFGGGAGLVASSDLGELLRIQELLGGQVPLLLGARDVGTALGIVIALQPDLVVVDANLELGSGANLVLTLPTYAPRTKGLLLTDDRDTAARVRRAGFDAERRDITDHALLSWASSVTADVS